MFDTAASFWTTTHLFGLLVHHGLVGNLLKTTWVHGVVPVDELVGFFARDDNLLGVGDNDVVTKVLALVVDWLVLAHELACDIDGQRAEHTVLGRDVVPCSRKGE